MSISVSYNAESFAAAHESQRALQPHAQSKAVPEVTKSAAEANATKPKPKAEEPAPTALDSVATNRSLSMDVFSPDYRIKVMVERDVGDRTQQTVLNFYKKSQDTEPHQGNAMDVKA